MNLFKSALIKFISGLLLVGLLVFLPALMVARIRNEETVLSAQLQGYEDYKKKVRYRLIPWLW